MCIENLDDSFGMGYDLFSQDSHKEEKSLKMDAIFRENVVKRRPIDPNGSVSASAKIEWGGKEGIKYGGDIKGEIRDNRGNYGEIKIERKTDGTGSATVTGGHKENSSKDK